MKPSERRALLEKKRAEKEAEAQWRANGEMHSENETSPTVPDAPMGYGVARDPAKRLRKWRQADVVKKEGFFSKYSMLIAGIITALVVILGVAVGIDCIRGYVDKNKSTVYDDGINIDMESVNVLHDSFYSVEWRHLEGFNYTDYSYSKKGGKYILREYPIEGTDLVLRVGGPESQKEPDFIYVRSYEPSEYIDISVDDPRYYFYQRGYTDTEDD